MLEAITNPIPEELSFIGPSTADAQAIAIYRYRAMIIQLSAILRLTLAYTPKS